MLPIKQPLINGQRKCALFACPGLELTTLFSPTSSVVCIAQWSIPKIIRGRMCSGLAMSPILTVSTGESTLIEKCRGKANNYLSLWDSFRSQIPFLTIFDPNAVIKMVRSLIDTQRHLGWLPDCRMSLCKGNYLVVYSRNKY